MPGHDWKYHASFDAERKKSLLAFAAFSEVIDIVVGTLTNLQLEACYGRDPSLKTCIQPVFTFSVSAAAFDAFFNSPHGYRAQYLADPSTGLAANLKLIEALTPRLRAHANQVCVAEVESIDLDTSLAAASCKTWLYEDDFPFQSTTGDLTVEPWILAAAAGEEKARWGLCAPTGSRLQVKGALLDPAGNEVVPRRKIGRRYEIQRFGFS